MNIKEGWVVVIGLAIGLSALTFGVLIGRAEVANECSRFGAFFDTEDHKWECKKVAP